ncbi:AimR family lysis-lysogeny pheromone receptor [Bacillus bombysepticus]
MKGFLNQLIDEIDFQRLKQEDLAKKISISGGNLSKNLSGNREFNFWTVVKLLNILYEGNTMKKKELIHKFCTTTVSKKNSRIAMEYANTIGDLELLGLLIEKEKTSSLAINREWAYVYELVWKRGKGILTGTSFLEELELRKNSRIIKTKEMHVLLGILTFYTMYDLERFNSLFDYAEVLLPEVNNIQDEFVKTAFSTRIKEGLAYAYLTAEKIEECRALCHQIINTDDMNNCLTLLQASAFVYLGESYMLEDYSQAEWHIKKSLSTIGDCLFERMKKRKKNILNTYAFFKLINGKQVDFIEECGEAEKAFNEIVNGDKEVAKKILKDLKIKNGKLSAMQTCILGLANGDEDLVKEAIKIYECGGNLFYSKFAKILLEDIYRYGTIYVGGAK